MGPSRPGAIGRSRAIILTFTSTEWCSSAAGPAKFRNVSLLFAIGVNDNGYREILGICEGAKEDKGGWSAFLKHLTERGLKGVRAAKRYLNVAQISLTVRHLRTIDHTSRCVIGVSLQGD